MKRRDPSIVLRREPAATVIRKLGGIDAVADHLGLHRSRVWAWAQPFSATQRSGTNGVIPQKHHVRLLDFARAKDVPMTAGDFLPREATDGRGSARPAGTERRAS